MGDNMAAQTNEPGTQVGGDIETLNRQAILTRSGIGMIIGLVVQYLLGMANNLFVTFPHTTDTVKLWIYAWTHVTEALHIILGIIFLVGAPVVLMRAIRAQHRIWVTASAVGLAGIIIAFVSGVLFVITQADPYSLVMSYGFLLSFVAYGWGLYSAKKK